MTNSEADRLAREAIEIMRSRVVDSIRYCEAYEGTDRTVVLDGSMFSPSTRAYPNASRVWDSESADAWEVFTTVTSYIEGIEVADGRTDSDAPEMWTLDWEDGVLFAYAPEYSQHD